MPSSAQSTMNESSAKTTAPVIIYNQGAHARPYVFFTSLSTAALSIAPPPFFIHYNTPYQITQQNSRRIRQKSPAEPGFFLPPLLHGGALASFHLSWPPK